ncbi:origin recognition complex subunit 2 [Exophiala viscosa]|uniref:origin recognition complex subunit 2 n=1 Tax=Exophiala viscosa TaxID=2486360 RepID=UPI00219560EB|nr:origin recognition complex subunit 2 [Exophiala viscosa]
MAKRKQPEATPEVAETPSKRRRKTTDKALTNGTHDVEDDSIPKLSGTPKKDETPSKRKRKSAAGSLLDEEDNEGGSPTPKANGRTLFSTPQKSKTIKTTPSKSTKAKADRSAKRKSARALEDAADREGDEEEWDGQAALAQEILEDEDEAEPLVDEPAEQEEGDATTPSKTPGKRGRPKGAKNKRSPTPEGDIPPEERYFFQNRAGPPQVSSNKFTSVKLLGHDEYFEQIQSYKDHHEPDMAQLMKLHARSFPQWKFELAEDFGLCLYGYGSKRQLVTKFAEWLHKNSSTKPPRIVIVNGYTPRLNIRGIINTIAAAIFDNEDEQPPRLTGPPHEMLDTLLPQLLTPITLMINSIDAGPLRKSAVQSVLARLADHPMIQFLVTADTPTFPTLWNSSLLDQFKFVYHDCTTFAPYSAEINVVDEVHELLGRKRLRTGGKEGIGFVLKSLPENARNLYRLLLSEILCILTDGIDGVVAGEDDDDTYQAQKSGGGPGADEVGVEYRALYQKASTDFICSSSMNFQFLLKEFHDHQLITSRRDATGTEMLSVPLGKEEMEAVLEELSL